MDNPVEVQPGPVIEFNETEFDFGPIEEGERVSYVFKFTNTGDAPLLITEAKGSCGCTVPSFPKVPIMPGEGSEIEVEFNSKGKLGKQTKRITITANTTPAQTFLTMSGMVIMIEPEPGVERNENDAIEAQRENMVQAIRALDPNCFAIFPNPTNDLLQLELKEHIGLSAIVDIRNETGTTLLSKTIEHISRESTQFDVSDYAPGVYMITIRVGDFQPMTQCFVVTGK
jgi:hypothetical protein